MLYDLNKLALSGYFKPFDIVISILVLYYFFSKNRIKRIALFNDRAIKWMLIFIIIYIIYTPVIAKTSNLLEAFRASRLMLYIFLFYIFNYYLASEEIFHKFFLFLKFTIYATAILIFIEFIGIDILFNEPPKQYGIPRIYFYHFTLMLFLLSLGVIQRIVKYSGEYKIKNLELIFCLLYIITSLTRSLWIATIGLFLIIQIISFLKIYSQVKIKNQKVYLLLIIFILIFIGMINYLGWQNIFLDRIIFAGNDIKYGEGTFSGRIESLKVMLNISEKMGLVYTGFGFPHGFSDFVNSFYFLQSEGGSWGSETGIGSSLIYFGYIGTLIFHILIFTLAIDIMKKLKKVQNKLVFSIGLSISIVIFVNFLFITWASPFILVFINLAFLLSIFDASLRIFENNNNNERLDF